MTAETPRIEFDLLVIRAANVGMYLNRHKVWDALSDSGGDLYLMERRTRTNPRPPTLVRYATVAQIEEALSKIERETFG